MATAQRPQTKTPKKVLMSVCWAHQDVYYVLLLTNRTINSDAYCEQVNRYRTSIHQKGPSLANQKGIHFHHDNGRPHTSLKMCQKLLGMFHFTFHFPRIFLLLLIMFPSLQTPLIDQTFNSQDFKTHLEWFLATNCYKFFEWRIFDLTRLCQKLINQNGKYIKWLKIKLIMCFIYHL